MPTRSRRRTASNALHFVFGLGIAGCGGGTEPKVPTELQKIAGDNQTASLGQPVALPLTIQVNDESGRPVANVAVTFTATGGTLGTTSATTGTNGRASTGFTPVETGAQQVTATVVNTSLTTTFTETGVSPFAIELQFLSDVTPAQMAAFTAARQRWESLIVGDVANVSVNAPADSCGTGSPAIQRTVDDLLILVTLTPIDGTGNVLGASAPCFVRVQGRLPVLGLMRLDADDLDQLEAAGLLQTVILHEMGHVLGFGTIWTDLNLLADASPPPGTDPHFTGAQATTAFNAVGGASYMASLKVPVENTGGPGTADSHWRETVFGNELMTGTVNEVNPLSRVTAASLADLGYTVKLADADPYTLAPGLRAFSRGPGIELKNDVLRVPLHEVDGAGRVVRVIPR
jgi:Leishmanolysin/Bacterial Ig-like domain (group 1)